MFTEKDLKNFGKEYGLCLHFGATGLKKCMGSDLCKQTLTAVLCVTKACSDTTYFVLPRI